MFDLKEAIKKHADENGIPRKIVYGVCMKESGMNPFAARFEPNYRWTLTPEKTRPAVCSVATETMLQKTSIGVMQVMGAVYRELGFKGWLSELFVNPELQIEYGCKHLGKGIKRYGLEGGIAVYNGGSPDKDHDGKIDNPEYVRDVLAFAEHYTE